MKSAELWIGEALNTGGTGPVSDLRHVGGSTVLPSCLAHRVVESAAATSWLEVHVLSYEHDHEQPLLGFLEGLSQCPALRTCVQRSSLGVCCGRHGMEVIDAQLHQVLDNLACARLLTNVTKPREVNALMTNQSF